MVVSRKLFGAATLASLILSLLVVSGFKINIVRHSTNKSKKSNCPGGEIGCPCDFGGASCYPPAAPKAPPAPPPTVMPTPPPPLPPAPPTPLVLPPPPVKPLPDLPDVDKSMMPPLSVAPGKKGRAMPPAPVAPPPPPPPPLNVEMGNILEGEDEHGDWHMMNITGVVEAGSQYSAQVMPASYKMYKAEEARIAKLAKRHGIKNETDIPKPGFEPTAAPPMLAGAEESDDEDKKEPLSEEEMSELKAHAQKFRFVEPWPTVYEEYLRATPAPPPPVIPTIMPEFEKGEHPGEMFVIPITTAAPVNETAIEEGEGAEGEAPAPPAPAYFYYY